MVALGAELTLVPSEGGLTTRSSSRMIDAARAMSREPHTFWTDQLNNQDSVRGLLLARRGDLDSNKGRD